MNWDDQYKAGQGRYFPAEELVRFLGRTYGPVTELGGGGLTAVEIGCGVGGNVRALAEWGFFTYGLDISQESLKLARKYAEEKRFYDWVAYGPYHAPDAMRFPSRSINLVVDVQTIQHLNVADHQAMYREIYRVLHSQGVFFSIHWVGSVSDLPHIFPGHPELCLWQSSEAVRELTEEAGFRIRYHETVSKTYRDKEGQWAILEAVKA
jgi:ubiquinone/menaquinone biosynthesis C-methylase UbiE